jgi:hypothetical protein
MAPDDGTPLPSPSDIGDVTPPVEPLLYHQGQPISREAARERMEALQADPAFRARIDARDGAASRGGRDRTAARDLETEFGISQQPRAVYDRARAAGATIEQALREANAF